MRSSLYTKSPTIQRSLREYSANGHKFSMVAIEKGSFLMQGDHEITFEEDFEMGQYPVTQALWEVVKGENPSLFKGANRPVENVSWDNIRKEGGFIDRLNALPEIAKINNQDSCRFALPSEAQWEYAARGGRYGAAFPYEYAGSNYLSEVGWYNENSQMQAQTVGRKQPNILGLHDIGGNALEWCEDTWDNDTSGLSNDGSARITVDSNIQVIRGGSWSYEGTENIVVDRSRGYADNQYERGFRLARYRTKT